MQAADATNGRAPGGDNVCGMRGHGGSRKLTKRESDVAAPETPAAFSIYSDAPTNHMMLAEKGSNASAIKAIGSTAALC
jgi:hypothetical protein